MPIRFQVDPDFYDHPKSIGMSDAAAALWVRAGSYSAAKLTDGFIAEHVLATLSRTPEEAADELTRRGLWRRVKGGFRFHQWSERNLVRVRVEADREYDRDRKRKERLAARQNGKPQADPQVVHSESNRSPPGHPPDSGGNPGVSVSVSVSESVSGSGQPSPAAREPPRRCPQHIDDPQPPPCGGCADARLAHDTWDRDRATRAAAEQSARAHDRAATVRTAIDACHLCDDSGYTDAGLCSHDPDISRRARRGAEVARSAIPTIDRRHLRTEPETGRPPEGAP